MTVTVTGSSRGAPPARPPAVTIIVPCFDEERTIAAAVARVLAVPLDKEVIVVDDGSTDGTRAALRAVVEGIDAARVVLLASNRGKGAALRRGLADARGEVVVVHDADLEYDARDISAVVQPILDGDADVVFGSRFLGPRDRSVPSWQRLVNRVLTATSNAVTRVRLSDVETGAKAFRTSVLRDLDLREDRFGFDPEVTVKLARRAGLRIREVPVGYRPRTRAEGKKIGARDAVRAVYCLLWYGLLARR